MTALELILLELILVPGPRSQFACVHNNETRAASTGCWFAEGLRLSIRGVEAWKAKLTTITMVSDSQTFNTGPSMGRLSCFSIAVSSVRVKFNYCFFFFSSPHPHFDPARRSKPRTKSTGRQCSATSRGQRGKRTIFFKKMWYIDFIVSLDPGFTRRDTCRVESRINEIFGGI